MTPDILRSHSTTADTATPLPPVPEIGPETLKLSDREMSRLFEAGGAEFFSEAFEDIARCADAWWQYHHGTYCWLRITIQNTAEMLDERRPEFIVSDQNHARRREIRRAAKANPDTGETDDS